MNIPTPLCVRYYFSLSSFPMSTSLNGELPLSTYIGLNVGVLLPTAGLIGLTWVQALERSLLLRTDCANTNESVKFAEASESANRSVRVLVSSGKLMISNMSLLLCGGHWQAIELYNDQSCY
jgi:hypothetical protein